MVAGVVRLAGVVRITDIGQVGGATLPAQPVHGGVRHLGGEPQGLVEPGHQFVRRGERGLAHPAAPPADDVQVGGVLGEVVARRTVVDVGVPDQTQLLKCIEGAVHRRRGNLSAPVARHGIHDLVRGRVTEPPHGAEHPLTLRGQPLAAGPQSLAEIAHPTNVCRHHAGPCIPAPRADAAVPAAERPAGVQTRLVDWVGE